MIAYHAPSSMRPSGIRLLARRLIVRVPKWKRLHAAATKHESAFEKHFAKAFKTGRDAIDRTALQQLISASHMHVEIAMDRAIQEMKRAAARGLPELLLDSMEAGGIAAARNLNIQSSSLVVSGTSVRVLGMRKTTRQDLRKLREIVREQFREKKCYFCKKPLLEGDRYTPGAGEGSPFKTKFTLHHKNGNHADNSPKNRVWVHADCHKSHHLKEQHADGRIKQGKEEAKSERLKAAGGPGSGNFGHAGRPGVVGGSGETEGTATFHSVMTGWDSDPIPLFNVDAPGHELHGSTVTAETLIKHGFKVPEIPAEHGIFDKHGRFIAPKQTSHIRRPRGPWDANVEVRIGARVKFAFDRTDEDAVDWADKHAAELIDGIAETSRDDIREAIAGVLEGDLSLDDAVDEIVDAVGDETRARVIARTETMTAVNEGQRQMWDQAVEDGLLTGNEKRVWIATPSESCPICDDLDGEEIDLDGEYPDPGGDGPPAHPNCRCTEGLSA